MVKTYANVEEILLVTKHVEQIFELSEIPFEPFKEEQEEGMHNDTLLEKQVSALNESFIDFFKGTSFNVGAIPPGANSSTMC